MERTTSDSTSILPIGEIKIGDVLVGLTFVIGTGENLFTLDVVQQSYADLIRATNLKSGGASQLDNQFYITKLALDKSDELIEEIRRLPHEEIEKLVEPADEVLKEILRGKLVKNPTD